jgi:hypothetical protein
VGRDQRATSRDGINLMVRGGTLDDVSQCYTLHESLRLPYSKSTWRILPEMWRTLLSKGAMQLGLVTNRIASRIVSFSSILFITDEFCSEVRFKLPPYLGVELARQYLSGELPGLNRKQVARANAREGLNVMMCFDGSTMDGLSPEQLLAVREKQGEALHLALRGYRVKEFVAEPIGNEASQWMFDAGVRLRRDYSEHFRRNGLSKPQPSRRPLLVGLTKNEAFAHSGGNIASLFICPVPRFYFNRSERVLLQHALMGETCEQLAASLSISPWTVKKRWHAIYDRVADIDPELLPTPVAYGSRASSRGTERRRLLLNYLRQHLEELRPYEPPRQRHKSSSQLLRIGTRGDTPLKAKGC